MSDINDALTATATILRGTVNGSTTLDNVYTYITPADYAAISAAIVQSDALPFLVIEEGEGLHSVGDFHSGHIGRHQWLIHCRLYLYRGENRWPSAEHAAARQADAGWVRAINDVLSLNQDLGGTVFQIGQARGSQYHALADYAKDHDHWNAEKFWTLYIFIPVTQIYDR